MRELEEAAKSGGRLSFLGAGGGGRIAVIDRVTDRKTKSGEWWEFISRHRKWGFRTEGEDKMLCFDIAKKIESKLIFTDFSLFEKEKIPDLTEYGKQWPETCMRQVRKASKRRRYWQVAKKYIYPDFGVLSNDKMTRGKFWDMLLKIMGKGFSGSSVSLANYCVRAMYGPCSTCGIRQGGLSLSLL